MLNKLTQLRNRYFFLLDLILIPLAAYFAFALRLDRFMLGNYWSACLFFTAVSVFVMVLIFKFRGVYARYWRYASTDELVLLVDAATIGVILAASVSFIVSNLFFKQWVIPRSVPVIFLMLAIAAVAMPRLWVRILAGRRRVSDSQTKPKHVLIAGAGDAGQMLAREIRRNPRKGLQLVGFIDDDPLKQGLTTQGVPILGGRDQIPELVSRMGVEEVIIAMPSASGEVIREICDICDTVQVQVLVLPSLSELLTDRVGLRHLRPVDINDLLRRDPIQTDLRAVYALVEGKTVLITGAGGSIGSELCRQIAKANPRKLLLLGHGENSIFGIQNELMSAFKGERSQNKLFMPIIADVRDAARLNRIFEQYRPDVVFHAAAHKHVPMMEANPIEAITNNILGTHILLETCLLHDVERFVLISTDKAVKPVNVMGVTKRVAELLVQNAAQRSGRPYVAVRFGNVLGSRGSVVPFFKKQIEAGGPVTVTHPAVSRYFMTIPEAVQLVLQAATLGRPGDLFILDMGEPVRIVDLAKDLIRLSGLTPEKDIAIIFTGLRPGEKLKEELFQANEDYESTQHEKILRVTTKHVHSIDILRVMEGLYEFTRIGSLEEALALIAKLVPEYTFIPEETTRSSLEERQRQKSADMVSLLHARWY